MSSLTSVVASAKRTQTATVLWFHGLGDTGAGWYFLSEKLSSKFPHVKWIFPNAPLTPVTMCKADMPAWFDLSGLDKSTKEDEKGMLKSITTANKFISQEVDNGIAADRIIVGGFSQGCVLALLTGLTSEYKLAGIIGCSGWLGLSAKIPAMASDANKKTPILMCHGTADEVVNPKYGQESADKLQKMGYDVTTKTYPGLPHSINDAEVNDIAEFLTKTIG